MFFCVQCYNVLPKNATEDGYCSQQCADIHAGKTAEAVTAEAEEALNVLAALQWARARTLEHVHTKECTHA